MFLLELRFIFILCILYTDLKLLRHFIDKSGSLFKSPFNQK